MQNAARDGPRPCTLHGDPRRSIVPADGTSSASPTSMSTEHWIGVVVAAALTVYLLYALVAAERM